MLFNFPCFIINEKKQENFILIISTVLCHVVLNMYETKYGMQTIEHILREFMKHGFERMCIVYEILGAKVCIFIYTIIYILLYIYIDILITIYFYVCRWKMKERNI
jgi:hypothetical protein